MSNPRGRGRRGYSGSFDDYGNESFRPGAQSTGYRQPQHPTRDQEEERMNRDGYGRGPPRSRSPTPEPVLEASAMTEDKKVVAPVQMASHMMKTIGMLAELVAEESYERANDADRSDQQRDVSRHRYEQIVALTEQQDILLRKAETAADNAKKASFKNCVTVIAPNGSMRLKDMSKVKVNTISGGPKDDVMDWIQRLMEHCAGIQVSHNCILRLMMYKSTTPLRESIELFTRECETLKEVVIQIEGLYGRVLPVEEARIMVQQSLMKKEEDIHGFVIRMHTLIKSATRLLIDPKERLEESDRMLRDAIRRVVPASIMTQLKSKEADQMAQGRPPWDTTTWRGEIHTRQVEYDAIQARHKRDKQITAHIKPLDDRTKVEATLLMHEPSSSTDEYTPPIAGSTSEGEAQEDPVRIETAYALYMNEKEQQYAKQGYRRDTPRFNEKSYAASRRFHTRNQEAPAGGRSRVDPEEDKRGRPSTFANQKNSTLSLAQLVIKANCGENLKRCYHCGLVTVPPHRARKPQCGLNGREVAEQVCPMCSTGLHKAEHCPKAKMSNYQHPVDPKNPLGDA